MEMQLADSIFTLSFDSVGTMTPGGNPAVDWLLD